MRAGCSVLPAVRCLPLTSMQRAPQGLLRQGLTDLHQAHWHAPAHATHSRQLQSPLASRLPHKQMQKGLITLWHAAEKESQPCCVAIISNPGGGC